MSRPTKKTSDHRPRYPKQWSRRHLHVWIGSGEVAYQVQLRVWRFDFGFTFWRSYGE